MLSDYDAFRDIYLVFMNTEYKGSWLFKDGFRHVYVIERQALGWLCSDPSRSNLFNCILPASYEVEVMETLIKQNPSFTILHLHVRPNHDDLYPYLGLVSCVSIVQYILGMSCQTILTPYQLYNKLKSKPPKHIEVI